MASAFVGVFKAVAGIPVTIQASTSPGPGPSRLRNGGGDAVNRLQASHAPANIGGPSAKTISSVRRRYRIWGLHELTSLERCNIRCVQIEPLAILLLVFESFVPVRFDSRGIISANCVDGRKFLR